MPLASWWAGRGLPQSPGRIALALLLIPLALWLRRAGQAPFDPMLTHDQVGRVIFQDVAAPWELLGQRLIGLLWQAAWGLWLPDLMLLAGLLGLIQLRPPGSAHRDDRRPPPRLDAWCLLAGGALGATLAGLLFSFSPYSSDEFSYRFQARLFAGGALTASPPSPPAFYESTNLVARGQWYSQYTPGWSALMTPFELLEQPWLLHACLGAAILWAPYRLAWELYGGRAANGALILLVLSPSALMSSATLFPHAAHGALLCAGIWGLSRSLRAPDGILRPFLAGLILGAASLVRPTETLLLGLLLPCYLWRPGALKPAGWALAGSLLVASSLLIWQLRLGEGFYEARALQAAELGHSLPAAIWNTAYRLIRLQAWAPPLFGVLFLAGFRLKGGRQSVLTAGYLGICALALASFYNLGQVEFSTRYLLPGYLLAALQAGAAAARLFRDLPGQTLAWVSLASALACWPGPLEQARQTVAREGEVRLWLERQCSPGALVFVANTPAHYAKAWIRNEPDLRGPCRMVLLLEPEANRRLRALYPTLPAHVLDFRADTGTWSLQPFDGGRSEALDLLTAGVHYANSLSDPDTALAVWSRIPPASPAWLPAASNMARLCSRQGRHQEVIRLVTEMERRSMASPAMLELRDRAWSGTQRP